MCSLSILKVTVAFKKELRDNVLRKCLIEEKVVVVWVGEWERWRNAQAECSRSGIFGVGKRWAGKDNLGLCCQRPCWSSEEFTLKTTGNCWRVFSRYDLIKFACESLSGGRVENAVDKFQQEVGFFGRSKQTRYKMMTVSWTMEVPVKVKRDKWIWKRLGGRTYNTKDAEHLLSIFILVFSFDCQARLPL